MLQKYFKTLKRKSGPNRNVSTLIETLTTLQFVGWLVRWLRGTVVERRYMTANIPCVDFYLYPTVNTALIHLIKPGLMK